MGLSHCAMARSMTEAVCSCSEKKEVCHSVMQMWHTDDLLAEKCSVVFFLMSDILSSPALRY